MTDFKRDDVQELVGRLSRTGQLLFALLCAERLYNCCWAFSKDEDWDISAYVSGCNALFDHLTGQGEINAEQLHSLRGGLDQATPNSDEYGHPLAVQAQSGMVALLSALDLLKDEDPTEAVNAASAVVDALDNYEYFLRKTIAGTKWNLKEYSLLDREIGWQAESAERLREPETTAHQAALALRLANRSFMVPPAV